MSEMRSEMRDNGPYQSEAQAVKQFEAITAGMPSALESDLAAMSWTVLRDALFLTGVQPGELTEFEAGVLGHLTRPAVSEAATVQTIAGWVFRAYLAGRDAERRGPA